MHLHSFAWLDMVKASFPDELWYSNFRVTLGTFTYILYEIGDDISRQDTPMREAVTRNRRLAISLYYLASTRLQNIERLQTYLEYQFLLFVLALRRCAKLLEIR